MRECDVSEEDVKDPLNERVRLGWPTPHSCERQ